MQAKSTLLLSSLLFVFVFGIQAETSPTFRSGPLTLDTNGTIMGTVKDKAGNPLPGVHVHGMAKIFKGNREFLSERETVSDAAGAYRLDSMQTSDFASDSTIYYFRATLNGYQDVGGNAYIKPGKTTLLDFSLELIHSLHIHVVENAASAKAIAGAHIGWDEGNLTYSHSLSATDLKGWALLSNLQAGKKSFTCAFEGYATNIFGHEVGVNSRSDTLEVDLAKTGVSFARIKGILKSSMPIKTDGDTVVFTATSDAGRIVLFAITVDSSFIVQGIPAGTESGILTAVHGSKAVTLTGQETLTEVSVDFPILGIRARSSFQGTLTLKSPNGWQALFRDATGFPRDALGRPHAPE